MVLWLIISMFWVWSVTSESEGTFECCSELREVRVPCRPMIAVWLPVFVSVFERLALSYPAASSAWADRGDALFVF